ncbi:MAG TPA: DUF2203 domain-containing protein [Methylomirabilota bacterium]|nr:DUF2203 domain-containing protein [Methylomirabilota bacterium]
MTQRLFTPEEVNRLIPRLTELLESAMERYRQAVAVQERLREARARRAEAGREGGPGEADRSTGPALAERLDGLGIELRQAIEEIESLGGVVKDLGMGLVDFPGRGPGEHRERVVNLCWRYGESAVEFWHGMDEGFAQRKPLA